MSAKLPAKLRKAAIVISTLDTASADRLLEQMPPEHASLIRRALVELDDIHSAEQDKVIHEFLHSREPHATAMDTGVELDPSLLRRIESQSPDKLATAAVDTNASPFRFLHEAATDAIGRLLQRENPQIAAVVLSHLPPEKAANILVHLSPDVQAAVLRRVADLDSAHPDVLRDLESELQLLLADQLPTTGLRSTGLAAVHAILRAADSRDRKDILENLHDRDGELATRLHRAPSITAGPPNHLPISPAAPVDQAGPISRGPKPQPEYSEPLIAETADTKAMAAVTHVSFADVTQLSSADLARLFHRCDPQVTLLALTGAEEAFVERLFAELPPRDAKLLRRRMQQLGPLLLRDVESAQQRLADVAARMANEGAIQIPVRGFAAAA